MTEAMLSMFYLMVSMGAYLRAKEYEYSRSESGLLALLWPMALGALCSDRFLDHDAQSKER